MTFKSINNKTSDSSENVQTTNILKWQRTQHGKQCLSLQHLCHWSPRPAWSRFLCSRDEGVTFRPKGEVLPLLFPALLSDIVGWWCPFVLTLWRGSSPAEWGAAKRSSSYAQLDKQPSSHQHVPPAVQCQVIWPGEAAVTVCALEWLHSRVFAVMPRQFIRTSELPGAAFPGTLVGFLSCMCSSMSLQVRTFRIHFVAALEIASVDTPFSRVWGFRPSLAPCALDTKWWDWTGKRERRFKWWANTALWFQCCETWGSQSAASQRLKAPGPRYCCHFLGHVSFLNLEGGQLDLFLMKHSSGEEDMLKITTEWKKTKK